MSDVFISHVREDADVAKSLADELEHRGFSTWYCERDAPSGSSSFVKVGEAIDNADALVLVISAASVDSKQVTTEVVRAREFTKPILPVLLDLSQEQIRQPELRDAVGAAASISLGEKDRELLGQALEHGLRRMGIDPSTSRVTSLAPVQKRSSTRGARISLDRPRDQEAVERSVFVSYARTDKDFALMLAEDLLAANIAVWVDVLDIRVGDTWDQEVQKALQACQGLLVILSPNSVKSRSVMDEVSFALDEGKRVVPVIYQECRIPFRLRRIQHTDFRSDYAEALSKLISQLRDTKKASAQTGGGLAVTGPHTKSDVGWWLKLRDALSNRVKILAAAVLLLVVGIVYYLNVPPSTSTEENLVAVMPFLISGDEPEQQLDKHDIAWLMGLAISGAGPVRSVDDNQVRNAVLKDPTADPTNPDVAGKLARDLRASNFILGSVRRIGATYHLEAKLFDADGTALATHHEAVEAGSLDSLLSDAVGKLARGIVMDHFALAGDQWTSLAAKTTRSTNALKAFWRGEDAMREFRLADAQRGFAEAIEHDSTFALAWYGLIRSRFSDDSRDEMVRILQTALRHSASLDDHVTSIIQAYLWVYEGKRKESENRLRRVTQSYPDNAHAWSALGEVTYHSAVSQGRSPTDASRALKQAARLDNNNLEGLYHLAHMAISEKRFGKADTLIDRLPDVAAEGRRYKPQLRNLRQLASAPDSVARAALFEQARYRGDPLRGIKIRLRRIAGIKAEEELNIHLSQRNDIESPQRERAEIAVLENRFWRTGRLRPVHDQLFRRWRHESLEYKWMIAMGPMGALLESELLDVRNDILRDYPQRDWNDRGRSNGNLSIWSGKKDLLRFYMAASLSLRAHDSEGYAMYRDSLDIEANRVGRDEFARNLALSLDAFSAYAMGDVATAEERADSVSFPWKFSTIELNWFYGRMQLRHMLAMIYIRQGLYEKALPFIESLEWSHGTYQVASYLYRAQCYEGMGDIDRAIEWYTRFVEHWRESDPALQELVREADATLDKLRRRGADVMRATTPIVLRGSDFLPAAL